MKKRNKIPISVQLILENEDKILLMKRKNTGYEDGKYSLPGGHVEKNEEIRKALVREIQEEIGIHIDVQDVEFYKVMNRKVNAEQEYVDFIFKTKHWTGKVTNKEKDKCEEIIWVNKEEIPENTLNFIPQVLKNNESNYLSFNWEENRCEENDKCNYNL